MTEMKMNEKEQESSPTLLRHLQLFKTKAKASGLSKISYILLGRIQRFFKVGAEEEY